MGPNCGCIYHSDNPVTFKGQHIHHVRVSVGLCNNGSLSPCNTVRLTWCKVASMNTTTATTMRIHLMTVAVNVACRRDGSWSRLSWAACLGKQQPLEARMRAMGLLPQGEPENKVPHDRSPVRVPIRSSHKHNNYTANRPFTIITLCYNSYFQYQKKKKTTKTQKWSQH
jgi:hypothetical protein